MALPVLLVPRPDTPHGWGAALERVGRPHAVVSGHEAIEAVRQASATLVLCEQVAGWQAVARGVRDAGGQVVLLGEPPSPAELKRLGTPPPEIARSPEALTSVLARVCEAKERMKTASSWHDATERLTRFAESLTSQGDLEMLVQEVCARTREICDADGVVLFLVNPETGALEVEGPYRGVATRSQREVGHLAADTAQPVRLRTSSVIAVPLLRSGDVIGVLAASRDAGHAEFTQDEVELLGHLARPVAAGLLNAQAHHQLREAQARVLADNAALELEVKARTAQLSQKAREWEETFDAIEEPLAVQDGFTLRRVNRAYAARAGIPIVQIPGMACYQALAGRDSPCAGCPLLRLGGLGGEVEIKGGRWAFSAYRRSAGGAEHETVVHYRDVTAQRALEARLRESERMASIGQLASGAAHEINNPLGFMISNLHGLERQQRTMRASLTELIAQGLLTPAEVRERLEALMREADLDDGQAMIEESLTGAERVAAIVRGLRDLARLEVRSEESARVGDSVARAIRAELSGAQRPLHIELRNTSRVSLPPLHLDQILAQLLRNARQATEAGQQISVRSRDEGEAVVVEVEDEGHGIAPEHLSRIFEPFFTARGVGQGVGLGLTSAYGIAQRHGGSLEARSQPGKGAVLTLRVPSASSEGRPKGAPTSARPPREAVPATEPRAAAG